MQAQGIGVTQASLYIAWSEEYENQGNCRKADLVYQEGFKKCAEPHEKLQQFHKYGFCQWSVRYRSKIQNIGTVTIFCIVVCRALQARVSRQVMMNVEEDDDSDNEPKQPGRVSLADLKHRGKKKAIAPVNRTGHAIRSKHAKLIILLLQVIMNCHIFTKKNKKF